MAAGRRARGSVAAGAADLVPSETLADDPWLAEPVVASRHDPAPEALAADSWLPEPVAASTELGTEPPPPEWAEVSEPSGWAEAPEAVSEPPGWAEAPDVISEPETAMLPEPEPAMQPEWELATPPVWPEPPGAMGDTDRPERTPSAPWLAIASVPVADAGRPSSPSEAGSRLRAAKRPAIAVAALLLLALAAAAVALALHHTGSPHAAAAKRPTHSVSAPRTRPADTANRAPVNAVATRQTAGHNRSPAAVHHTASPTSSATHTASPTSSATHTYAPTSAAVAPRASSPASAVPAPAASTPTSAPPTRSTATSTPRPPTQTKSPTPTSQPSATASPTGGASVGSSP